MYDRYVCTSKCTWKCFIANIITLISEEKLSISLSIYKCMSVHVVDEEVLYIWTAKA